MGKRLIAIVVALLICGSGIFAFLYVEGYINVTGGTPPTTVYFTIIESTEGPCDGDGGINNSACPALGIAAGGAPSSGPWPIMRVVQGERVVIHIENTGEFEEHGFSIAQYLPSGVVTRPGQSQDVTFIASQTGTFKVYCQIFCSIHQYMQNGELIVSAS